MADCRWGLRIVAACAALALVAACCRSPSNVETTDSTRNQVAAPVVADHSAATLNDPQPAPSTASTDSIADVEVDEDKAARAALPKAIDFLMKQQADDGGFKSTTYGPLKHGPAMTSLALYALSHAPAEIVTPHREALHRAYMFLRPGLDQHGQIAAPDGTLDYPTYDAALVLVAARRLKLPIPDKDRRTLEQWLVDMQLTEKHGIESDSIHYGGWDLEAASGASGDQLKGSNIALSALCLEALSESMHSDASAAVSRARNWILGAQNPDGGFVFHPWRPHPGNKAMWEDDDAQTKAYSYGTPTCDGLRSLHFAGFKPDEKPVTATVQWLIDHPEVKLVPGLETKAKDTGWRDGLRYYYYYTQAKSLALLPEKEAARRREELKQILVAEQKEDGRFQNEQPRMFEDDPLLATSLAIVALSEALR